MNLLRKLNLLYIKNKTGIPFTQQDITYADTIACCGCNLYKENLIIILADYVEDWSYKILKKLSYDENESIRIAAIRKVSEFLKTKDFWNLYEEFSEDSQFVTASAIAALDFIGVKKEINDNVRIHRLLGIKKNVPDSSIYVHLVIDTKLFLDTEDEKYLENIFSHVYHRDHNIRYQALDSLDEIAENISEDKEVIQKIKNVVANKIKNGDEYRDNRIQASQILYKICTEDGTMSWSRYPLHEKEGSYYKKLCKTMEKNPRLEDVLNWCIFQIYYPVEKDYSYCFEMLEKYSEQFYDEKFYIFAAYIEYAYGSKKENKYLEWLKERNHSEQNQGVILILLGLWEMKYGEDEFESEIAKNYFEKALKYLNDVPVIYEQLSTLISVENEKHLWTEEQSERFKTKISLTEIERLPLERLYNYEMFVNMTILRKIEQPEYFLP